MLQLYMKRALFNFKGHYRRNEKEDEEKCYNNLIGKPPLQKKNGIRSWEQFYMLAKHIKPKRNRYPKSPFQLCREESLYLNNEAHFII